MEIIEIIIFAYFIYVVGYTLVFTVSARLVKEQLLPRAPHHSRFCILIPAYREDTVIVDTVQKALRQFYPSGLIDVVVIADSLKAETLSKLESLPIKLIQVYFKQSTKVKSLNRALEILPPTYDFAVVIDADNSMAPNFISNLNCYLHHSGALAVQGQRKPKNTNTSLSFLDGVSEGINNTVYRQGSAAMGLSSSIAGSGFAVLYPLLKKKLRRMNSVGGFDRELEVLLVKDGIPVRYHKQAVVFDEKVSGKDVFKNQRRRWISSQYYYLKKYFNEGMGALLSGNMQLFNTTILRNIQLPRLLNIGILFCLILLTFLFPEYTKLGFPIWGLLFAIYAVVTFVGIPKEFYTQQLMYAVFEIPALFLQMGSLLFRLRGANRKFIHTPHHPTN